MTAHAVQLVGVTFVSWVSGLVAGLIVRSVRGH